MVSKLHDGIMTIGEDDFDNWVNEPISEEDRIRINTQQANVSLTLEEMQSLTHPSRAKFRVELVEGGHVDMAECVLTDYLDDVGYDQFVSITRIADECPICGSHDYENKNEENFYYSECNNCNGIFADARQVNLNNLLSDLRLYHLYKKLLSLTTRMRGFNNAMLTAKSVLSRSALRTAITEAKEEFKETIIEITKHGEQNEE